MKQLKSTLLTLLVIFLTISSSFALTEMPPHLIDEGIFREPSGGEYLQVKVRPSISINGTYSGGEFVVRYPTSLGITLSLFSNPHNYVVTLPFGGVSENGGFTYVIYSFGSDNSSAINWPAAPTETTIVVLKINGPIPPSTADISIRDNSDPFADAITFGSAFYHQVFVPGFDPNPSGSQNVIYHASVLPIELTNFTARAQPDHTVALDWETATEINFSHYEVEHSTDGIQYAQIGKVKGNGTQNGPEVYGFIHDRPVDSDNYYRLRNVDNDGASSYSPVRIVRFSKENDHFILSPNPTAGPFSLISPKLDHYKDDLRYQIFDVTGKLIEEGLVKDERLDFDLSNYKSGMYSFAILSNKEFIKQFQLILTTH